jgi:non-heme Fe2+,alpha-ketoglutarate-dependent halogenase
MPQTPTFRMIPQHAELDQVPRDLRFHPCTNQNPRLLSRAEIERFNREGFLKGFRVFHPDEVAEHRRYFDALLARVLAEGKDSYSISTAHLKYGKVYDLLTEPRIVALVRDLLGENVIGWGSHYFCKMPGDGKKVSWHQDASYWPLTPSKTVSVWLAIDDADRENACMRFIAGSHHFGHLTYRLTEEGEGNVLDQSIENPEQFGPIVYDELRAGEISLHNDMLLHGSESNQSTRRRCGLTLRYCSADVRAHLDWNQKGVVVSGVDKDHHWANPPRPVDD